MLIEFDKDYQHVGNRKIYRVIRKVLVKQPDGSWVKGVCYERKEDDYCGEYYVRTDKNFVERFRPLEVVKEQNDG